METDLIIPFDYLITSGALSANASAIVTIVLQQDSSFELEQVLGNCSMDDPTTVDVSGNFSPNNFSVQITDQGTGRQLSNARIPQALIAATARFGTYRKRNVTFPPRATLALDFLNLTGSSNTINVVLRGYKILRTN